MTRDDDGSIDPASDPYRWAMLGGLWLIYTSFGATAATIAPLVEPISADLGMSHLAMGTVMGAWPLIYMVAAVPCGALLDRIGPRRALAIAAALIGTSCAARGLAVGHVSLFLAVALFGLGGPLVSVGAPKLISLWFEGRERGMAMGLYVTGPAVGGISALSLTNSVAMPLADGDWRKVLFAYGALALATGLIWLCISAHRTSRLVERRVAAEPKGRSLEVFATLLRVPVVRLVLMLGLGILFINHALGNWLPELLRGHGMHPVAAGYWASVPTAVGVLGALVIPRLATPERRHAVMLLLILATGASTLLLQFADAVPLTAGLILQGISRGSTTSVMMLLLVEAPEVGPSRMGAAAGLFFSAAEVGGVLGPMTLGYLSDASGDFGSALYLLTGICVLNVLILNRLARSSR